MGQVSCAVAGGPSELSATVTAPCISCRQSCSDCASSSTTVPLTPRRLPDEDLQGDSRHSVLCHACDSLCAKGASNSSKTIGLLADYGGFFAGHDLFENEYQCQGCRKVVSSSIRDFRPHTDRPTLDGVRYCVECSARLARCQICADSLGPAAEQFQSRIPFSRHRELCGACHGVYSVGCYDRSKEPLQNSCACCQKLLFSHVARLLKDKKEHTGLHLCLECASGSQRCQICGDGLTRRITYNVGGVRIHQPVTPKALTDAHTNPTSSRSEQTVNKSMTSSVAVKGLQSTSGIHLDLDRGEAMCADDLRLMECVGHGTSGSVFRGTCAGCVGDVAIKTFRPNGSTKSTKEQQKMFLSEVEMLRRLRHPRLLRFLGACVGEDQILYIVTEYMTGGTIFELLHTEKTALAPVDRFRLALHVTEGVAYLHSQDPPVVHRDLKSPNIMVDKTPVGWIAKIIDYGLAECLMKTHVTLPPGKGVQGSAGYMSPECFVAPVRLTIKIDVWALGCILIEVFGGKPPHSDCENIPQVITKLVIKKKPPSIPSSVDDVGGATDKSDVALKEIVDHCFEFDVSKRATAAAVLGALRRIASQRAICIETTE